MMRKLWHRDALAIAVLVALWVLFFWRILTPIAADQASFKQGDFSAQFVAFAGYQYERMAQGEIPLWNPYNNGGLPFIGDTQAAVFYPPRLLTIAIAALTNSGMTYHVLELEAIAHVLLYTLLMYAFVRRLTYTRPYSIGGAFISAVVIGYGGFTAGYPPLQLALLEAAVWLPLGALGILEATRTERIQWRWLAVAGFALGVSWLAGHPQTSWFSTYLLVAWLGYRCYTARIGWRAFVSATMAMGAITFGTTAITFLPAVEYLALASRGNLGFDAKANGFPIQDVMQVIAPGVVSLFSPLYIGIPALVLVLVAVRYRQATSAFWGGAGIVGLLHSFGGNTAFYQAVYYLIPGLTFFRGQERAAFVVANSLAILAGLGAVYLAEQSPSTFVRRVVQGLVAVLGLLALVFFVGWIGDVGTGFGVHVGTFVFSWLIACVLLGLLYWQSPRWIWALALLIVFELFSVNMGAESNYDPIPPQEQISLAPPSVVQIALDDAPDQPYRVDGFRGLEGNYGSLYGVMDMRGISPLFLAEAQRIIDANFTNNPLAWELFAVRYVFSERERYGTPTTVIGAGTDRHGAIYVHELDNPRPFAHLVYDAEILDSDAFAFALLRDPAFDPRTTAILVRSADDAPLRLDLPDTPPAESRAHITQFDPEALTIDVSTPDNALLSLAHVDYPGWIATRNGEPTDILRAYGALSAVYVPAGEHQIQLHYRPLSFRIGAMLSAVTWGALLLGALMWIGRRISREEM